MAPCPQHLLREIDARRDQAREARKSGNAALAWASLEDAHVLSQEWVVPHCGVHLDMLRLAVSTRDRREVIGQLVRLIVAGPGSATGKIPVGNSGRSNVSIIAPMPIRPDLADLLDAP